MHRATTVYKRGLYDMSIMASTKVLETRQIIGKLFNIEDPFNIIFTSNTTDRFPIIRTYKDTFLEIESLIKALKEIYNEK